MSSFNSTKDSSPHNKNLQVEIFNNISNNMVTESVNTEEKWREFNKDEYEAGKIANSICLNLLRGDVNYSLTLEKILNKIIELLNSDIGVINAISDSSLLKEKSNIKSLTCIALGEKTIGMLSSFSQIHQCKGVSGVFGYSIINEIGIISNDVENDSRFKKNILPEGHPQIHKIITIPLCYQNTVIGIISIANSKEDYNLESIKTILPFIDICSSLLVKSLDSKETLVSRIQKLDQVGEAKDKFLATMSHELRTPLNGIMGMVTLFPKAGPLNPKQRLYVKNLTECTIKLTALLNNLLDFSKMSSDRLSLKKNPFSIKDAVDDSMKMIEGNSISKEIDLNLNFPNYKQLPMMIGDRQRLVQILSNLLANAVKFTEIKGNVTLTVNTKLINKGGSGMSAKWEVFFLIKDTGLGIPKEDQEKIFDVFYQSTNLSPFLSNSGTGLGLPISQELVRLMDGKISVKSDGIKGNGSEFAFYIILDEEINISVIQKDHMKLFTGARILIVDDRPEIRLQLTDMMFNWKCIPQAVSSAEEALQYLQYGLKFNAALIDINMPEMSGIELAQEIREKYPDLPLIGISSVDLKGGDTYFDFYMYKPIDQNTLFPALLECITKPMNKINKSSTSSNVPKKKSKKNLKILIAEDDHYNRFTIKEMLTSLGYSEKNITIVENGLDCLKEVEKKSYDVILMDIVMPVMDGLESSKRIKRLKNPPIIIAVSAAVQPSDKSKCQGVGIDGYLSKPIIIDKLETSLKPLIKKSKKRTNELVVT
jgi:signal transduction histidine kinase/CheY-like chemotaxis protein